MRTSLAGVMALSILCAAPLACGGDDDEATDQATDGDDGDDMGDMAAESCSSDMFDKYGLEAFAAVNDSIIEKSVAAPTSALGTSFQILAAQGDDRVAEFRANLASFLVMVYGGPDNYDGPDMRAAHAGLGITSEQYDFFITDVVVPALAENGVPTADIEDCFAPPVVDPDFKNSIINQ